MHLFIAILHAVPLADVLTDFFLLLLPSDPIISEFSAAAFFVFKLVTDKKIL